MTTDNPIKQWIEERRAIHEAATEGPWVAEYSGETGDCVIPHDAQSTREAVAVTRLFHRTADANAIADARNTFPRALDALEQVLEIHRPVQQVFSWQAGGTTSYDPCETCHGKAGKPGDYECGCWSDRDLVYTCAECRDDKGRDIDWPCATVQAIEGAVND